MRSEVKVEESAHVDALVITLSDGKPGYGKGIGGDYNSLYIRLETGRDRNPRCQNKFNPPNKNV